MDTRTVSKLIDEAAANIATVKPGTVITHLNMGELIKIQRHEDSAKYYALVAKLKTELQKQYGIFLATEYKVGYIIAQPGEEINLCQGEFDTGKRKMWKAVARTNLIRINNITDPHKQANTISRAQTMANLAGLLKAGQQQNKELRGAEA